MPPQALLTHTLTDGWFFKQADDDSEDAWLPVARVPTNVHLDLIDHGKYVDSVNRTFYIPTDYLGS